MAYNILFIYPPDREECVTPEVPPLGLAYLATFLRKNAGPDIKVSLIDLNIKRISKEAFENELLNLTEKPDLIGIGGVITVFNNFLWISKVCKKVFPQALIVAGGSLASTAAHLLFKHSPVDLCVKGEGEHTLLEIVNKHRAGAGKRDMSRIDGLFSWDNDKEVTVETPSRPRTNNLDIFGMPAYDLIDVKQYASNGIKILKGYVKDFPSHIFSPGSAHMAVTTSRGCSGRCTFCFRQFPYVETNSAPFVKEHILFLHDRFGINVFSFIDELFNVSESRLEEMHACFLEIRKKIPSFSFRIIGARVDMINTEWLKKMKDVGCFQIIYGLESGSDKMLKMMKKRVTVEQNRLAVLAARDAGLHCVPQFVIGLPGEDAGTLKETLDFMKSIDFWSYMAVHKANAYPGSDIYKYAQDKGLIKDEFSYISSLSSTDKYPLQLADMSAGDMDRILKTYRIKRELGLVFRNNNLLKALQIIASVAVRKAFRKSK